MEGTEEVVESVSHEQQLEKLGFQAPTFSSLSPNLDPDSPKSDHDHDPPHPPTTEQQQQLLLPIAIPIPIHEEEFQRLDLKEEEEENAKKDDEECVVVAEEVGGDCKEDEEEDDDDGWRSCDDVDVDVDVDDHPAVVVDDDDDDDDDVAEEKKKKKSDRENDGLNYDKVEDDDDVKERSENDKEVDGWGVDDDDDGAKRIEIDTNYGWNDDGWNDYHIDDDVKKRDNGNDGWGGYNNHVVDDGGGGCGWKKENIEEMPSTTLTEEEEMNSRFQYPLRPDSEDCSFYVRTGTCKFGTNCKFNHPVKKKYQGVREKVKTREEYSENPGQIECKYYLRSGGCKFGKACRYNHSRGKSIIAPVLDLNFVGLPIRPGEKECPYYMRTGSCKYAANCRFNHPDPTSGSDPPPEYVNGTSHSLQGVSQPTVASWSSSRTLSESAPYVPMMFPPTQGISSQNTEWNGYQAPAYPQDRHMHPSTAYVTNNSAAETNVYTHHQQQMLVEDFPERPGQPECSYFLKTGDCKYRSNCKFHHPKNRISKSTICAVTDKGLPLRPDQNICTHYSRYGICKFGPNCKFDHPTNIGNSVSPAVSGPDQTFDGVRFGGSANGSEAVM